VTDRTYVVAEAKAALIAKGLIPDPQTSNEHAFLITAATVWRLRQDGAKLTLKASGNNFRYKGVDYSIDAITFLDGWADCLVNAGPTLNENRPSWIWHPAGPPAPGTVADPVNVEAAAPPVVAPPVDDPVDAPPPIAGDLVSLSLQLANLAYYVQILAQDVQVLTASLARDHGLIVAGVAALQATQQRGLTNRYVGALIVPAPKA
jgi:hypothetical protein